MLKKAVKYHVRPIIKILIIYYCLDAFLMIENMLGEQTQIEGFGIEYTLLLFGLGIMLNSHFKMFSQNGISRRTFFNSSIISIIGTSILLGFINSVGTIIFNFFMAYSPLYLNIYGGRYSSAHSRMAQNIEAFLWVTFMYMFAGMLGYFIGILYARMSTKLTYMVSIGILTIVTYIIVWDNFMAKGAITNNLFNMIKFLSGYSQGYNPYYFIVTASVISIILGLLSCELTKRIIAKTA